jgi:hypothetical protein
MRTKLEPCAERRKLEFWVTAAVQKTYIARHALQSAKTGKCADTTRFIMALEFARSKRREAEKAHSNHVEGHGCGLSGISFMRTGS